MVSIAVQAGGRSSRMGHDKALQPLAGMRLIEHVLAPLQDLSDDLFITTNQPAMLADLQIPLVADELPGRGALYGLKTALSTARHDDVLIVACDMPFLARRLIEYLISLAGQADVVIPHMNGEYEPMLAVYRSSTCLPAIERSLRDQEQRMISFFHEVRVHTIGSDLIDRLDPGRLSFFNINTPEDIRVAEEIFTGLRPTAMEDSDVPSTNNPPPHPNGEH
jgi:molybdopterin-guanine dinucleotide biosynthesis protein A